MNNAHESAISCLLVVDENTLVSGDDDGMVRIWDLRQAKRVHELNEHEDFISDIQLGKDEKTLLCSGGDGYLRSLAPYSNWCLVGRASTPVCVIA
jgi:WD40 repeat protein